MADAEEKNLLNQMRGALNAYFDVIRSMIKVAASDKGNDQAIMNAEVEKGLASQRNVTDTVKAYSIYTAKKLADMRLTAEEGANAAIRLQIAVAAIGIVLGVLISLLMTKFSIVSPLRNLT